MTSQSHRVLYKVDEGQGAGGRESGSSAELFGGWCERLRQEHVLVQRVTYFQNL